MRRRAERARIVERQRVGGEDGGDVTAAAMRRRAERARIVERQRVGGEAGADVTAAAMRRRAERARIVERQRVGGEADEDAPSAKTTTSSRRTWDAGIDDDPITSSCSGGALAAPATRNMIWRARFTAGTVSVSRRWSWYGPAGAASLSVTSTTGSPGGHEAVWPSSPSPRWTTSRTPSHAAWS